VLVVDLPAKRPFCGGFGEISGEGVISREIGCDRVLPQFEEPQVLLLHRVVEHICGYGMVLLDLRSLTVLALSHLLLKEPYRFGQSFFCHDKTPQSP